MYDKQLRKDIKFVQSLGWSKHKSKSFIGQLKVMTSEERNKMLEKFYAANKPI